MPSGNDTKLNIMCESYSINESPGVEAGKKKVTLEGTALVFGRPTRNRIFYTLESARNTISTWIGRPFLNSHDDSDVLNSIGHVEQMNIDRDESGRDIMKYKVDIDPEERDFIRKAKRKDIPFVSVQVLVSDVRQKENLDYGSYLEADIREGLELSSVLIPGDWESNGIITEQRLAEKFGLREQITDEIKEDKDEETPLKRKSNTGMVPKASFEEDVTTATGGGLMENPSLGDKVKGLKKTKITPDTIPGVVITKAEAKIDDVLAKKTNTPDETQEDQELEYEYDKKVIPYYKKGGNNVPAPFMKGVKVEGHSIWNHCSRPMIVGKNSNGSMVLSCLSCGKTLTENRKVWNEMLNKVNTRYEFIKTTKAVRRS